jgi:hypothetical protein
MAPTNYNPLSKFTAPRTPGPLGRNDAADLGTLTSLTPGSLGLNDDAAYDAARMADPMDFDYLLRHHESKSHLVESLRLPDLHLKDKHGLWSSLSIWGVAGAIVFRVSNLSEDLDGSARAYHPPTDASWSGHGHGLGKDSLANAVGRPGVTKYAHSKKEEDWALTAGCQLFRDLHKAKGLEAKAAAAAPEAKDAKDTIFKKYGVTKLSDLEAKGKSAVCVLYVDGRRKKDSQERIGEVRRPLGATYGPTDVRRWGLCPGRSQETGSRFAFDAD